MADNDFADYEAPTPAIPTIATAISSANSPSVTHAIPVPFIPDSPWYALWQRHSASEFLLEFYVVTVLAFIVVIHFWGVRRNRRIARDWIQKHKNVLDQEFAMVGFDIQERPDTSPQTGSDEPLPAAQQEKDPGSIAILREDSATEFSSYATGRNNIAFANITISLMHRPNPIALIGEFLASFIFDTIPEPRDTVTITLVPFDGEEKILVPNATVSGGKGSKFDNFVWAVVNKKTMNRWRQERYDLSLTTTKDWDGLPRWCSLMTEVNEIGDLVLTSQLKEEVEKVGGDGGLEYLLVSDQRREKPTTIEQTTPKKRLVLHLTLPTSNSFFSLLPFLPFPSTPSSSPSLLQAFIRLTDHLVNMAPFRPEVRRKLKATRDEEVKALEKVKEEEEREERDQKKAEEKKKQRDNRLRGMSAEEQKRFLEKEKEKEMRRAAKKGRAVKV